MVMMIVVILIKRKNKVQLQPSWQDKSHLSSFSLTKEKACVYNIQLHLCHHVWRNTSRLDQQNNFSLEGVTHLR